MNGPGKKEAKEAINKSRAYVEKKLEEKAVIYGLTTGFGKFANVAISHEQTAQLQENLIISHTCSMGDPYPTEFVRAAMLLRCNNLSHGYSGIRLSTIQTMVDMLNAGIHPIVPEKGSVGSSGDLAPLSCIALGLIGKGKVEYKGTTVSIIWTNSNVNKGVNIAFILQYGHGTRNGGYVVGRDYINPAMQPVFDKIADEVWAEVTKL